MLVHVLQKSPLSCLSSHGDRSEVPWALPTGMLTGLMVLCTHQLYIPVSGSLLGLAGSRTRWFVNI